MSFGIPFTRNTVELGKPRLTRLGMEREDSQAAAKAAYIILVHSRPLLLKHLHPPRETSYDS